MNRWKTDETISGVQLRVVIPFLALFSVAITTMVMSGCKFQPQTKSLNDVDPEANGAKGEGEIGFNCLPTMAKEVDLEDASWIPFRDREEKGRNKQQKKKNEKYQQKYMIAAATSAVEIMALSLSRRIGSSVREAPTMNELVGTFKGKAPACFEAFTCTGDLCQAKYPHVSVAKGMIEANLQGAAGFEPIPANSVGPDGVSQTCSVNANNQDKETLLRSLDTMCSYFLSDADLKRLELKESVLEDEDIGLIPRVVSSARIQYGGDTDVERGLCVLEQHELDKAESRENRDRAMTISQILVQMGLSASLLGGPLGGLLVDDVVMLAGIISPSAWAWLHAGKESELTSPISGQGEGCGSRAIEQTKRYREDLMFNDLMGFSISVAFSLAFTAGAVQTTSVWANLVDQGALIVGDAGESLVLKGGLIKNQALRDFFKVAFRESGDDFVKTVPMPKAEWFSNILKDLFGRMPFVGDHPQVGKLISRLTERYGKFTKGVLDFTADTAQAAIIKNKKLYQIYLDSLAKLNANAAKGVSKTFSGKVLRRSIWNMVVRPQYSIEVSSELIKEALKSHAGMEKLIASTLKLGGLTDKVTNAQLATSMAGIAWELTKSTTKRRNIGRINFGYAMTELSDDEVARLADLLEDIDEKLSQEISANLEKLWANQQRYQSGKF